MFSDCQKKGHQSILRPFWILGTRRRRRRRCLNASRIYNFYFLYITLFFQCCFGYFFLCFFLYKLCWDIYLYKDTLHRKRGKKKWTQRATLNYIIYMYDMRMVQKKNIENHFKINLYIMYKFSYNILYFNIGIFWLVKSHLFCTLCTTRENQSISTLFVSYI